MSATTNTVIDMQIKELETAERNYANHSCTQYSDGWCIGCQEYMEATGQI